MYTSENEARLKTLREVRKILDVTGIYNPIFTTPRTQRAAIWSAPFVLAGLILNQLAAGMFVAALVFYVVWKRTPNETWNERFCKVLVSYQPLDTAAFEELLLKIKDNSAKREDVELWLRIERAHVEHPNEVAAEKQLLQRLPR